MSDPSKGSKELTDKVPKVTKESVKQASETVGKNAKDLLMKAAVLIEKSTPVKQLIVGSASGWCTGFLTTRVGKTAALSVGGSIILVAAASQSGLVNIDWDKLKGKMSNATEKLEQNVVKNAPKIQANVGKYARTNTYFAAGFIGGFLIGICS